jgi:phosphoglucosamine mutase
MPRYPQVQESIPVSSKELPPALLAEVEKINAEQGESGRVLVRPSGTEPVVRVLAEAQDFAKARELCGTITSLVLRELG